MPRSSLTSTPTTGVAGGRRGLEGGPPLVGEPVAEQLIREFGLGDRGTSAQSEGIGCSDGLEATVDFGVDPAHEERSNAVHTGEVASGTGVLLEARQVGVDHGGVTLQREDQHDVDAPPFSSHGLNGRNAFGRRRDLHQHVRSVYSGVEIRGGAHGAGGVTSQLRRDFDRHEPVETAAGIEYRSQ